MHVLVNGQFTSTVSMCITPPFGCDISHPIFRELYLLSACPELLYFPTRDECPDMIYYTNRGETKRGLEELEYIDSLSSQQSHANLYIFNIHINW